MRYPTTHAFLKWMPTAVGGGAVAIAAVWSEAKHWISLQAMWGWGQMHNPWIAASISFTVIAYVSAIIWTGQDRKAAPDPGIAREPPIAPQPVPVPVRIGRLPREPARPSIVDRLILDFLAWARAFIDRHSRRKDGWVRKFLERHIQRMELRMKIEPVISPEADEIGTTPSPSHSHRAIRDDIERAKLEAERLEALSRLELHRGLDAYVRGEARAPTPLADVAQIGTLGAAVFGIDTAETRVVIDFKNFGRTPAHDVTVKAVAGWFPSQPIELEPHGFEGGLGVTEAGHSQNLTLVLTRPLTRFEVRKFVRGGPGLYALAQVDYTDVSGAKRRRRVAYYLDPQGPQEPGKWMMSICPTGNDEIR